MGVTGLWRLVEPAGKPVPVETLENKVLAVDISIWLHQMVKGYQDAKGAPLPNAHLMGLFQRLCKLLYFRIKPVFVFDGAFPDLKKETIAKRQDSKSKYNSESERLKRELALILGKKTAISSLLGKHVSPKKGAADASRNDDDDIFKLPALPQREEESDSESEDESNSSGSVVDLHSVDLGSENFKNLPVKEKYDLLVELKETRKMNSWGKLHELPKKSDTFSDFQMQRLLKRRKVQECLEETEKEIGDGGGMSLNDLESLLNEEGIDTKIDNLPTRRIASDNNTRFLLINSVKQALADAKKKNEAQNQPITSKSDEANKEDRKPLKKDELEDDLEKAIKMSLECVSEADTSAYNSKTDDSWTSVMTDSSGCDSEEEDGFEQPDNMSSAKAYIRQYTDFSNRTIDNFIAAETSRKKAKSKIPQVDQIIEELNSEKSVVVDNIELSSSDDDCIQDSSKAPNQITDTQKELSSSDDDCIQDSSKAPNQITDTQKELSSSDDDCIQDSSKAPNQITDTQKELSSSDDDCIQDSSNSPNQIPDTRNRSVIELNTREDIESSFNNDDNVDITQTSVVCVENPVQSITLDKSTEDVAVDQPELNNMHQRNMSSDDEDDFEDVPELVSKDTKPVVQLTFDLSKAPDNDIFADVFTDYNKDKSNANFEDFIVENQSVDTVNKNADITDFKTKVSETLTEESPFNTSDSFSKEVPRCMSGVKQLEITKLYEGGDREVTDESIVNNKTPTGTELEITLKGIVEPPKAHISPETLNSMAKELQNEEQDLLQEKGRLDRIGRNITEQMTKEAQELLQIFGIPYIVAPMEAEAQCAFLESVNLTDGTITDDSDIWLFGGRTVYKNFFNQKKHVLQFLSERIERSFNLTREQLVLLALLVGSDYTPGVSGVGPVTALEILASFPFNKKQFLKETSKQAQYAQVVTGLQEFKKWVRAGKRTDNTSLKKKLKNVNLTDDFPSVRVVQAYLEPNVEKSQEKFTWGELDISILRDYTKAKFGWSQNKLDEIVNPVIKRMVDRKAQRTVHDYFKRKVILESLEDQMSKRVKAAVQRMGPEYAEISIETENVNESTGKKTKVANKRKLKIQAGNSDIGAPGPSKSKQKNINDSDVLNTHGVRVVTQIQDSKSVIEIKIPKTDRVQEIIPQREKAKQNVLQNKMKAIEVYRKTKIDRKRKPMKKRVNLPKDKAELSESSDSN